MEINYHKCPLTEIEYFYKDPTEVIAVSTGLFYSFPASETLVNPIREIIPEKIEVNPFDFEVLREAAADFNYRKGKELTNKIVNSNRLESDPSKHLNKHSSNY